MLVCACVCTHMYAYVCMCMCVSARVYICMCKGSIPLHTKCTPHFVNTGGTV